MTEFFRAWRRKVGLLTLLMACVVMVEWVRSMTNSTQFSIRTEKHACVGIKSGNQVFGFFYWRFNDPSMNWDAFDDVEFVIYPFAEQPGMKHWPDGLFRWRIGEFGWQDFSSRSNHRTVQFIAPHWSIVVPLTLLSAYLMLKKPKTSTPKRVAGPIKNDGGA